MQMRTFVAGASLVTVLGLGLGAMAGQQPPPGFNYEEAKVPAYTLPDPLTLESGGKVTTAAAWRGTRRPELLALFERHVYGKVAPAPASQRFVVRGTDPKALGGQATRKQVSILLTGRDDGPHIEMAVYLPSRPAGRVPAFLGLSFQPLDKVEAAPSWPIDLIVSRGYAFAVIFHGDVEPDRADARKDGVRAAFGLDGSIAAPGAAIEPAPGEWGALAAWGWGLSRALDYLATDKDIDGARVAVIGHSRMGKAALWAGARDARFAMVISTQSGEGGAAITRRKFGETIARINDRFPYWFTAQFKTYNDREDALPVDFHELIALVAPRPIYVSSATEDLWADPRGEFLSAVNADPVYRLLGTPGFGVTEMPPPDTSVGKTIAYHLRTGKHSLIREDWVHYLAFADRQFKH